MLTVWEGAHHDDHRARHDIIMLTMSPRYMAPEVFKHKPYNAKVDVYSFAMVMYQMLFRVKPLMQYDALRAAKLAASHHVRPPMPNLDGKHVSKEQADAYKLLVKLLQRCWAAKPEERYGMAYCVEWCHAPTIRGGR